LGTAAFIREGERHGQYGLEFGIWDFGPWVPECVVPFLVSAVPISAFPVWLRQTATLRAGQFARPLPGGEPTSLLLKPDGIPWPAIHVPRGLRVKLAMIKVHDSRLVDSWHRTKSVFFA